MILYSLIKGNSTRVASTVDIDAVSTEILATSLHS